ncbi:MAG: hypothetical protein LC135_12300 [Phycisphaerae bacterium]|nr:hypothetical protein [Phycisphaerae bacterium]MCZ2400632.1 hypothetical protein [Phycisphaerae bacterium]
MNRETFEQLVSQWLDNPADDHLRRRVEQAISDSPELLSDRRHAELIEQALHAARAKGPAGVDWRRLRSRIMSQLRHADAAPARDDARLDELLARPTRLEARIDWTRFQQRVSQRVAEAARMRVVTLRLRRVGAVAGMLATAAALVVVALLLRERPAAPEGFAQVRVVDASASAQPAPPSAFASVRVSRPAGGAVEPVRPAEPEFFLYIGPAGGVDASASAGVGETGA